MATIGLREDRDTGVPALGEGRDVARVQTRACFNQQLAFLRFFSPPRDERVRRDWGVGKPVVFANGVFDHEHGIGARRNGRAGHDFGCRVKNEFSGRIARANQLGNGNRAGEIGRVDSVAIAHGAVERWVIAVGGKRLCEHAAKGFGERYLLLSGLPIRLAKNCGARVFKAQGHVLFYDQRFPVALTVNLGGGERNLIVQFQAAQDGNSARL